MELYVTVNWIREEKMVQQGHDINRTFDILTLLRLNCREC
jgi:hypothetical protein